MRNGVFYGKDKDEKEFFQNDIFSSGACKHRVYWIDDHVFTERSTGET